MIIINMRTYQKVLFKGCVLPALGLTQCGHFDVVANHYLASRLLEKQNSSYSSYSSVLPSHLCRPLCFALYGYVPQSPLAGFREPEVLVASR